MQITLAQFRYLVDALTIVLPLTAPADVTLKHYFRNHAQLGQRDRAIVAETVYTVLRHRRLLEHLIPDGSPARMALVALVRFAGLSNRELMHLVDKAETDWLNDLKAKDLSALPFGVKVDLPDWVVERLRTSYRDDEILALAQGLQNPAPLDLRVNILTTRREAVLEQFRREGIACAPTPYSPIGIRLTGKISLAKHPLFLSGQVEVQDEGSQLLGLLVDARRGDMVADFCAGAGGKTLLLGAVMASTGRLYAFDVSEKRLANLSPRLKRSGLSNITPQRIQSENDTKIKRLAGKLDRVLVDAPCTGLGTLRRNPDLKWRQTSAGLAELNTKQSLILEAAGRLVKPGGRLIYGTCSLLREENEDIIERFLEAHPEFVLSAVNPIFEKLKISLKMPGPFLQLSPDRHGTDGFFAAVMERTTVPVKPTPAQSKHVDS